MMERTPYPQPTIDQCAARRKAVRRRGRTGRAGFAVHARRGHGRRASRRPPMPKPLRVATIVGSLRRESFSRKTANALVALAPGHLALETVEIGDLPLYNQD